MTPPRPIRTSWYRAAQVRLNEYDPSWPGRYADEAKLLTKLLAPDLVAIEHIGSTAVPGMTAKPIIDLLVAVLDYGRFPELVRRLDTAGYVYTPESEADDPDRRVFRKGPADISQLRTHHLHLTRSGSRYWHRMIAFRDHLRRHPEDAAAYVDLKRGLAVTHAADVDSVIFRGKPTQKSMGECVSEGLRIAPVPPVKLEIDVFLTDGTTDAEKQAIEARLRAIPGAGEVTFRSRQEGYERTKELLKDVHPEIMASAKPEDLPEALVLTMTDRELAYQANDQRVDEQLCRMLGVDQVLVPPKPLSLG